MVGCGCIVVIASVAVVAVFLVFFFLPLMLVDTGDAVGGEGTGYADAFGATAVVGGGWENDVPTGTLVEEKDDDDSAAVVVVVVMVDPTGVSFRSPPPSPSATMTLRG